MFADNENFLGQLSKKDEVYKVQSSLFVDVLVTCKFLGKHDMNNLEDVNQDLQKYEHL